MKFYFLHLFKILPPTLKVSWGFFLIGFLALTVALFTATSWQSYGGLGCLVVGYAVFIIDGVNPNRTKGDVVRAGFIGGLIGATLAGLIGAIVSALILAIVFGITSMIDKSIPLTVMQSLHIVGWLFALPVVLGVPKLVIKAKNEAVTEQGGAGQPATRPESK
jgi:hypothetical protein